MTEVVLVTGFLGTGKTTMINTYLGQADTARIGVVVNEAGDTPIDGALIAEAIGNASAVRLLDNGCLCCGRPDDLAVAIETLIEQHRELTGLPSARIIVEASGMAMPGPMLRQLRPLGLAVRVIATVDAAALADPTTYPEIAAQWASADVLVATRSDQQSCADAMARATAVNPLAMPLVMDDAALRAVAAFESLLSVSASPLLAEPRGHGAITVSTLRQHRPCDWDAAGEWFDNLSGLAGDRLLRLKSVVDIEGDSWLVEAVGSSFQSPRPFPGGQPCHAVVITRGLEEAAFRTLEPQGLFVPAQGGSDTHG